MDRERREQIVESSGRAERMESRENGEQREWRAE